MNIMDEDIEDMAAVGRAETARTQGKESEYLSENRNVLELRDRAIVREMGFPRSSIQQFVDILGGKDPSSVVNIVEVSQDPGTSYHESGENRVQELTFSGSNPEFSMMNEGEVMETLMNEWQHGNHRVVEVAVEGEGVDVDVGVGEALHERLTHKENSLATSNAWKDSRSVGVLVEQGFNHNDKTDAVLKDALSSGAMRMKIISRSSEFPEYFVKRTLKGKGVLCRDPVSAGGEFKDQSIVRGATPPTSSPLEMRSNGVLSSNNDEAGVVSCESMNDGLNMREWMRSRQNNLHKVDRLRTFKLILELVFSLHSNDKVLMDLRPSFFRLLPSGTVEYFGRLCAPKEIHGSVVHKEVQKLQPLKRPLEQGMSLHSFFGAKHQKSIDNTKFYKTKSQFQLGYGPKPIISNNFDANVAGPGDSKISSGLHLLPSARHHIFSVNEQLEEKWYRSPEELFGRDCTFSSNIYSLGVFFFELLSSFDSGKLRASAMSDLRHRIISPKFLSENPKETGFCLWLLHPEPSLRPTARVILQSEVMSELQGLCGDVNLSSIQQDEGESELLLHFLLSVKEQKQKDASKLVEDLGCIESDIKELERRHNMKIPLTSACSAEALRYASERGYLYEGNGPSTCASDGGDSRFLKNVNQLESVYFSARSQTHVSINGSVVRADRELLESRENWYLDQDGDGSLRPLDDRGAFFEGLCKYARYSKVKVCGTIRNSDITNSTNVVCSLSFDRDEDYFAAAGVSKKIKIFDFHALYDNSVDIHYPVIEMSNKSKLSCVCWNNYIRNYLASTDYDGIVKLWDASTGQEFSQHIEHEKRAWSVDFSLLDPMKLASGSDDCTVKLWSINERKCLHTIRNIANVCCVQFSPHSSHLVSFGSADYKIYCYDLRNANAPWCVLAGHEKAVSYVKFVDSATLISASTDNTLKLWDLSRTSSTSLSYNACSLTLGGHKNEKNFVGLSVADGYIACGSETNEVYTYYKSLPMPITSHKFGSIDPISGKDTDDSNGQFVSSVCWKGKSNAIVAANSSGCLKVLEMV
ncbi:protein SPA1-RELATED 2 isoform X2 [Amaranthus tricolor]|nr:protein SPA1-RELATED 2 isoform X2 [Amaranthus tricolor]XP_057521154.1 protein SPA1-RELATED 2 isoform X2 [Amaranthus tricolor]XP_057521155.1 protein SPA1-RELATED 2 isoform X2 [Amaranthus tricolor]XP_057521156.1 protein SPA1-RELATED 2 isoform X2 [Amaranthus tricolor]XP_057521157.1 protein SPA1-RELATED 2 isoform X2 [Amaranthus tricolor]